jgi:alpha-tubulin suppressor-like RCC1 family protein
MPLLGHNFDPPPDHCLFIGAHGRLTACGMDAPHRSMLGHSAAHPPNLADSPILADPHNLRMPFPRPIPALSGVRVRAVAAGAVHSICVTDDGAVHSWGYSGCGALGHGAVDRQVELQE